MSRRMIPAEERKHLVNVYLATHDLRWVQDQAVKRNVAQTVIIREALAAYILARGGHGEPDSPG